MKAEFMNDPLNLWYDIPGYDGMYQASRLGEIRRVYKSGKVKVLSQFTKCSARTNRKRLYVKIAFDGKGKTISVLPLISCLYLIRRTGKQRRVVNKFAKKRGRFNNNYIYHKIKGGAAGLGAAGR